MVGYGLQQAIDRYEAEVDGVAEELIEDGLPPWQAIGKAAEIVRERRSERAERDRREKATRR